MTTTRKDTMSTIDWADCDVCAWCGKPAKGLATIGDDHYCHEGDSPTCYEQAQQAASNVGDGLLGRLLADQRQQWQERHGDPTLAGARAFERLRDDQRRDAVREFANWVATQRAYNGSEHDYGQSLYNECINAVLPTWAEEWAAEQAPVPEETTRQRLLRQWKERVNREPIIRHATGDDDSTYFDEFIANGVDIHFEAMGQAQWWMSIRHADGRMWFINCGAVDDRAKGYARCELVEQSAPSLNSTDGSVRLDEQERREAAEQQRDLATATAADAVAKLGRLHDLLAEPAESRAGLLAQRMIRDALAGKETP